VFGCIELELLTSYGVKSAVDEFALCLGVIPEHTPEKYPTWYFEKPQHSACTKRCAELSARR
jgi:hypothetical protein